MLNGSVATLASLGHSDEPARIKLLTTRYYALADRLSMLVAKNASGQAALELGASQRPGGVQARAECRRSTGLIATTGREATRSRNVAKVGTIAAVLSLLLAFSLAFHRSVRERRLSDLRGDDRCAHGARQPAEAVRRHGAEDRLSRHRAVRDDRDLRSGRLQGLQRHASGIRRAMPSSPGSDSRLAVVVGELGSVYRIGGDEFVVIDRVGLRRERGDQGRRRPRSARAASVSRSAARVGSTRIVAGQSRWSRRSMSQTSGSTRTSAPEHGAMPAPR